MRIALAILLAAAGTAVQAVEPLVNLDNARYNGVDQGDGVTKWLGIRYGAAPVGDLRFRAPQDPEPSTDVVEANKFGPICPPQQPGDFTVSPDAPDRFTVDEDCLFLSVFAPTNATTETKLPVLFWIQGGGFTSNSNANYDATDLVKDGNIIVVQINYRVGMYGFLQSKEVEADGSLNNGIKDMIKALEWVQTNIEKFGGNKDRVVIDGLSAGGSAVALLLAANNGTLNLFAGGIIESGGWTTMRSMQQGQEQYDCLAAEKNCSASASASTLACLRSLDASALRSSQCWFGPHIDHDLFTGPLLSMYASGRVAAVPTIMGACANEGTKYSAPETTATTADAHAYFLNQDPSLTNASLALLDALYIDQPAPVFPGKGAKFRQTANAIADAGTHCIIKALQNALAAKNASTYAYRYAVRDPADERAGYGVWHGVNAYAVWGPDRTDGAPPASYVGGAEAPNARAVGVTRAYWTSFVRSLDPNAGRAAVLGAPEWRPWTGGGDGERERLVIRTNGTGMERMTSAQSLRCDAIYGFSEALGEPRSGGEKTELDGVVAAEALAARDCGFDDGCAGQGMVRRMFSA
ncbi:carboxylesterase [Diplodia corticola]|uniref:Carboxylic ester hydrolase n=1 Tax=Diplodia corticola TaxID=236234 RepID=A0A1J9S1V8_9PEZI|nr:carboxylesterase [Diplodia corticola]OJD33637.1 carboxylesterase [Diplodia corticola]